ncbi:MAG: hypothetical protein IJA20_06035 [Methanocorpusculum sp.]|nr:hypothetical protein [Oscillospiraceae bacterium]MBQ3570219.1 hypothetical protein [Methanocorpusculum sp.]
MNLSITIRFGKKDGDLMLMASQYHITDMLVLAVARHLGKTQETIPLPPNVPYKPVACATVYLNDEHEDAINFLRQFPNGFRSAAVKMLLRHAMEKCDLRHLLLPIKPIKETPAPLKPNYIVPAKRRDAHDSKAEQKIMRPDFAPASTEQKDEDDIFDLI